MSKKLVVRKNPSETVTCPNGEVPCSSQAPMTMCAAPDRLKQDCPITDVKLVKKSEYSAQQYKEYEIAEGSQDLSWYLLFSRSTA